MNVAENGPDTSADKLENSLLSIQKYVDTSNHSLLVYKRVNKILTLLILIVLGSFGTVIALILKNNLEPEAFRATANLKIANEIVPMIQVEWAQFMKGRGKKIQTMATKEFHGLVADFQNNAEERIETLTNELSKETDTMLQYSLSQIIQDQRVTLISLFPELSDDDVFETFLQDMILRLQEDNEMIVNRLHDEYLHKLDDMKSHIDALGRENIHMSKSDLQVKLIHNILLLLDHEFSNYVYEQQEAGGAE